MRETWRYDHMENQHLSMSEFWDETGEQWFVQFASRSSYEYDIAGRVLSISYADYYMDQWFPLGQNSQPLRRLGQACCHHRAGVGSCGWQMGEQLAR